MPKRPAPKRAATAKVGARATSGANRSSDDRSDDDDDDEFSTVIDGITILELEADEARVPRSPAARVHTPATHTIAPARARARSLVSPPCRPR